MPTTACCRLSSSNSARSLKRSKSFRDGFVSMISESNYYQERIESEKKAVNLAETMRLDNTTETDFWFCYGFHRLQFLVQPFKVSPQKKEHISTTKSSSKLQNENMPTLYPVKILEELIKMWHCIKYNKSIFRTDSSMRIRSSIDFCKGRHHEVWEIP